MQPVPHLVQRFITYLQAERHFSDHTARSYGIDLVQYFEFLRTIGEGDSAILAIGADKITIVTFVAELKRQHYIASSLVRKIAALRSFYKWMVKQRMVEKNPVSEVRLEKQPPRNVRLITGEQLLALLAMPDTKDFLGARDLAIIQTICATGVKADELIRMNRDNVDVDSDSPCIGIGGRNRRTLNLDSASLLALRRYLEMRETIQSQDPVPLFINKHGARMSSRSIRRKLNKYLTMADIDLAISPMTLRHTYAQHLIGKGVDTKNVQKLLGIRSTQTVITTYGESPPVAGNE